MTTYKVLPEEFIYTHIPFDPLWQLSPKPLTHYAIQAGDFSTTPENIYSLADSLALHYGQDTLTQLRSSIRRIDNFGQTNRLIQQRIDELNQQVIVTEHNRAIRTLNAVVDDFNQYITAKNSRFRHPKLSDKELKTLSESLNYRVDATYATFSSLTPTRSLPMQQLQKNRKAIKNIRQRIQQERVFIERYLKTWKLFRIFAFH